MQYIYKKKIVRLIVAAIDFIGYSFLYNKKKKVPDNNNKQKKILIFKPDHIGDVFLATPVFQKLKDLYPDSHITCVIGGWAEQIVKDSPHVDELITINVPWLTRKSDRTNSWRELIKIVRQIKKQKYTNYYCLRSDILGNFLGFLAKIPERVGFVNGGGGFFLTKSYEESNDKHQTSILLNTVEVPVGWRKKEYLPKLNVTKESEEEMNRILSPICGPDEKIAGFHIGAGYPSKRWPIEKFAILIKKVHDYFGYRPLIVGGKDDFILSKKILTVLEECKAINMCGKMSLPVTAAIMKRCFLFIGNDSAPVHIAASVGIPTVVIFSAANSKTRWCPIGNNVVCIRKELSCELCEKSTCVDNRCLNSISTEEVLIIIKSMIKPSPSFAIHPHFSKNQQ